MSLRNFFLSRIFLKNLIYAVLLLIVLLFLTMLGLRIYTHHGQSNPVPDFKGLTAAEALENAKQHDLKIEVVDSTHVNDVLPGVIVDQVPPAGAKVKQKRTISLTVNSILPEQILLPKLTDISFRQAQVLIENCGLSIGKISYQPSEYNDLVLRVQVDSVEVFPGEQLPKGTNIDFIIGRDAHNTSSPLPDLTGLTPDDAKKILASAMLNPGVIIYDESVLLLQDSSNVRIWKQSPDPKRTPAVNLGSTVDMWVTVDTFKIREASGQEF